MSPVIAQIKTEAYDPLVAEEITQQEQDWNEEYSRCGSLC